MNFFRKHFPNAAAYFFILLFFYAAFSKILDFENFQVQIAQSPLLSAYAGVISHATIISELIIVAFLIFPRLRLTGLYASLGIMSAFTIYIYLILNYSDFVPCSCGGVLEKMGWKEHLMFNLICVVLAGISVLFNNNTQQRKKTVFSLITILSSIAIGSSLIVIALFYTSEYIIKKENNFTRRFIPNLLEEFGKTELDKDGYYLAGVDSEYLYLGNRFTPLIISTVDLSTKAIRRSRIYPSMPNLSFKSLKIKVKTPYYYLYDGTVPIIYRGKIGQQIPQAISHNDAFFSQLAVLDSVRFALRTQSSATHTFTLALLDLSKSHKLQLFPSLIEKQIDGIFDADGQLVNNQSQKLSITYMYLYRNQFITINDDFGLIRKQKTIDNSKNASLNVTKLSNGMHTMSTPPLKVNSGLASYEHYVFIISEIRGRHEPPNIHKNRKTIDVYDPIKGEYMGSFYIPQKKIEEIAINKDFLFVLSGKSVFQYQFRKTFTPGEAENLSKE
ncbi:MauE/DoxX family redox-associated membrane protein [Chryseobacterium koreense]|uniref:MauE/DoxX family redox-associated membrane protein n=1 Tax=Chryseobacterium koreense TaxID=232216 RepID=UPI0026EDC71E|nr:MauE/DoxX family redox-associated membrane protein [Chryseobacterium koreense]